MNYFWKPYRATCCLIGQARLGDQSFWKESNKLLNLAAFKKYRTERTKNRQSKLNKHDFISIHGKTLLNMIINKDTIFFREIVPKIVPNFYDKQ